jgi:NAD(P)-dependent dehydrogenase (short-subunit alcohol dehydrogenase family)
VTGRICLVTGGTSGVGRSIAAACAGAGATVVIVSRDKGRGDGAARWMRDATGNPRVQALQADLSVMESVRSLADAFRGQFGRLHVLSLNAACLTMNRQLTSDGHESMFAANYLGHFLLTRLLLDMLRASAPARVIAVSGHPASLMPVRLDMDDLMLKKGFSPIKATARAALAKALFMFELARRMQGTGVSANTFHPGFVRSSLARSLPWLLRLPAGLAMLLASAESATGIKLAISPEVEGVTGRFFVGGKPAEFRPRYDVQDAAARLWEASSRLTGL